VLFVDYIAEHLNPRGRAGVIVPEGIIFQSGKAYKNLRKMLIEDYLWAVVSLPAGVFNPYSMVKTSILLMDKTLVKKSNKILFVKIDSDGFNLGAQRRPIDKNDLPQALKFIKNCRKGMMNGKEVKETEFAHLVERTKIKESGDWNLSGERYRDSKIIFKHDWERVPLGKLAQNLDGKRIPISKSKRKSGKYPYYGASGIVDYVDDYIFDDDLLLISEDGANLLARVSPIAFSVSGRCWVNNHAHVLKFENKATQLLVEIYLNSIRLDNYITGAAQPKLSQKNLNSIPIPLPPLDIQKAIVAEIDGFQKIIDGARQVVDNYKPTVKIDCDWKMAKLGEVANFIDYRGKTPKKTKSGIPLITAKNIKFGFINPEPREFINKDDYDGWMRRGIPNKGDVLFTTEAPLGNVALLDTDKRIALAQRIITLQSDEKILLRSFLKNILLTDEMQKTIWGWATGSTALGIKARNLKQIKVPTPPLSTQQEIVAQIEAEQEIVNSNKKLIQIFEQKIKDKISEVWGE